jgi:hypothetical protein
LDHSGDRQTAARPDAHKVPALWLCIGVIGVAVSIALVLPTIPLLALFLLAPPTELLDVLHPMRVAVEMARLQPERHLNLVAAELLRSAIHYDASILIASPNAGGVIERATHRQEPLP